MSAVPLPRRPAAGNSKPDQLPASALFVGVGGMGMRGLARLWQAAGVRVFGTDDDAALLRSPALASFTVTPAAEAAALLRTAACVVYSDAVLPAHPLREAARQRSVPELAYHEALGIFSRRFRTFVVTGTHGKSSTTAMLAHICITAGLDPTALVGAPVPAWEGMNARSGSGDLFIVEGDEYREHFIALHWQAALIVSVDYDHPDYFSSLADVEDAYSRFLRTNPAGWIGVRRDVRSRHPDIDWPTGTHEIDDDPAELTLAALPGEHMRQNAALAVAAAAWAGVPRATALAALKSFGGLGRRYELIGSYAGLPIISDYGHHPAEIAATLAAARGQFANQRILVLWEPHMLERLQFFGDDFARSLTRADGVVMLPTYQPGGRGGAASAKDTAAREHVLNQLKAASVPRWPLDDLTALDGLLARLAPDFAAGLCFSAGRTDAYMRGLVAATA